MAENGRASVVQPEPALDLKSGGMASVCNCFRSDCSAKKMFPNAAAVIALLHQIGFDPEKIAQAIAPFRGAARRQQELFRDQRFRIFDDYGHHPSEIRATLRALKTLGGRRLLAVFQPHRYTRTQFLLNQFASCFAEADRFWLTEVYAASEAKIPGVDGAALADAVRKQGQPVEFIPALEHIPGAVRAAHASLEMSFYFWGPGTSQKRPRHLLRNSPKNLPIRRSAISLNCQEGLRRKAFFAEDEPRRSGDDFASRRARLISVLNLLRGRAGAGAPDSARQRRLPFLLLGPRLKPAYQGWRHSRGGDLPGECSIHSSRGGLKIV